MRKINHQGICAFVNLVCHFYTVDGRRALLDINLKDVKLAGDCELDEIAQLTGGYSGADITNVCRYIIIHCVSTVCV